MRERQFTCFELDGTLFGVDILTVREILPGTDFTPVELAAEGVRGLLNLRGQIIAVADLSIALGLPMREVGPTSRCIVLKTAADVAHFVEQGLVEDVPPREPIGLLVDKVADVVTAPDGRLMPVPPNIARTWGTAVRGVVPLPNTLMLALALEPLLISAFGPGLAGTRR